MYLYLTEPKITLRFSRKRRLLQLLQPDQKAVSLKGTKPESSNNEIQILKERKIPKLVPIKPASSTPIDYKISEEVY